MTAWFTRNLPRVADERVAICLLEKDGWWTTARWAIVDGRLIVEGALDVDGHTVSLRVVYPNEFPLLPCWVEPHDCAAHLSGHQFGAGGSLCLEVGPDNWVPSVTGADILCSARRLLVAEAAAEGRVADGHHEGAVQAFTSDLRVMLGEGCVARVTAGTSVGLRAFRYTPQNDCFPMYLGDDADEAAGRMPPSGVADNVAVVVFDLADEATVLERRADLATHVDLDGEADMSRGLLAIARTTARLRFFHLVSPASDQVFEFEPAILVDDAGRRSGRAGGVAAKRVVIVGAGSVGSKVAESVVRAGVRNIGVIDGDVMLPPNLERHILDWRDIGYRKVHALARRLHAIAPSTTVTCRVLNLDWQQSAKSHAATVALIASADVIVDASGDMGTSLFLGAVASAAERAFVSVQVFEGGLGCVVARSVPSRDAAFADGRAAFNAWCAEQATPPPPPGRRAYEGINAEGEPVVADDAAVTMAAGLCARVALDILDGAVSDSQPAWVLLGFRQGWIFSGTGSSVLLDVGPAVAPPDVAAMAAADPATATFIDSLLSGGHDAAAA